jgi:hypothetical protein
VIWFWEFISESSHEERKRVWNWTTGMKEMPSETTRMWGALQLFMPNSHFYIFLLTVNSASRIHVVFMYNIVRNREDSKWQNLPEAHTCDGLGNIVLFSSPSKSHLVSAIRKAISEGGFEFNVK